MANNSSTVALQQRFAVSLHISWWEPDSAVRSGSVKPL